MHAPRDRQTFFSSHVFHFNFVIRYRQAQKVGAAECAQEWRNIAESAGVPPARLAFPSSMDSSHPTSVAAAQRQNKKEDQWPVLVQGLEDAYDDAQDLREVIEEARMANLPEAALRPYVSLNF